jgi:hypothetical protein
MQQSDPALHLVKVGKYYFPLHPAALVRGVYQLQRWFIAYVILWVLGICAAILRVEIGLYVLLSCIVPYIPTIVYAYGTQRELNAAGLYRAGAWQVIVGALLLNPFFAGCIIPASVLWRSRRIMRTVRRA